MTVLVIPRLLLGMLVPPAPVILLYLFLRSVLVIPRLLVGIIAPPAPASLILLYLFLRLVLVIPRLLIGTMARLALAIPRLLIGIMAPPVLDLFLVLLALLPLGAFDLLVFLQTLFGPHSKGKNASKSCAALGPVCTCSHRKQGHRKIILTVLEALTHEDKGNSPNRVMLVGV